MKNYFQLHQLTLCGLASLTFPSSLAKPHLNLPQLAGPGLTVCPEIFFVLRDLQLLGPRLLGREEGEFYNLRVITNHRYHPAHLETQTPHPAEI